MPLKKSINFIAYIISWNLWQMDGLKGVVPDSCHTRIVKSEGLFDGQKETFIECPGCKANKIHLHNGIKCLIRDWKKPKDSQEQEFHKSIR